MITITDDDVACTAESLSARADLAGINSLSSSEQVIVRVWSAFGIICNGGFQYFYEGSTDMSAVADAFEALGLSDAGHACRQSRTLFPVHVLASGFQEAREWMAKFDETKLDGFFDPFNHIIWGLQDNNAFVHALASYIYEEQGSQQP